MQDSYFQTYQLPQLTGANPSPALLVKAGAKPLRVLIRNFSANPVLLASNVNAFTDATSRGSTYSLTNGVSDAFVLAPEQALYAMGTGLFPVVSVAVSEASPEIPQTVGG